MLRLSLLCIAIHACYIGSKVVVSLLAVELGASQATIGAIAALYGAAPLVLGVHSGRLADTAGMRLPMLIGAGFVAAAMVTGFLFHSIASLFVVATLMGLGFVYYNVSIQNLTGAHGPPERRARNFSILAMAYSTSALIGPTFAGFAIDFRGHAWAFFGFALFAVFSLVSVVLSRGIPARGPGAAAGASRSTLELLRNAPLMRTVVMSGLMVAAWELFLFYMPLRGHEIGLSASMIGIVMGAFAAAAFVVRFLLAYMLRAWSAFFVLSTAVLIAAGAFVLLPLFTDVALVFATAFVIGLGLGVCQPISMMVAFERSPAGRTGEVTGLRLTANNVARIVVPLVGGALGAAFGAAPVFWMNALNLVAVSWLARR